MERDLKFSRIYEGFLNFAGTAGLAVGSAGLVLKAEDFVRKNYDLISGEFDKGLVYSAVSAVVGAGLLGRKLFRNKKEQKGRSVRSAERIYNVEISELTSQLSSYMGRTVRLEKELMNQTRENLRLIEENKRIKELYGAEKVYEERVLVGFD